MSGTRKKPRTPRSPRVRPLIEAFVGPVTVIESSQYASKCRRCGRWVHVFEKVAWSRGEGSMHLSPERCASALGSFDTPFEGGDDRRRIRQALTEVGRLVARAPWTYAKTQPHQPHEWSLRSQWGDDAAFDLVVLRIKQLGVSTKFRSMYLRKLLVGEYVYWTMDPRSAPPQATQLINRARSTTGGPIGGPTKRGPNATKRK